MSGDRRWTEDQQKAIDARGGTLFVSASAGSGKTAVLTERVVGLIGDKEAPCDADELLIVTFTRAAAAEMREKIATALRRESLKAGGARLKKQLLLLPFADICTMDAFCAKIVREHFAAAGVSPDFKLLSDAEEALLEESTVAEVLEELYAKGDDALSELVALFMGDSGDAGLEEVIVKLYHFSRSYPFPKRWIEKTRAMYRPDVPLWSSFWGTTITRHIADTTRYAAALCAQTLDAIQKDQKLNDNYASAITRDLDQIRQIQRYISLKDWDGTIDALGDFSFMNLGSGTKGVSEGLKEYAKNRREKVKKLINALQSMELPAKEAHRGDMEALKKPVGLLLDAVTRFSELLAAKKEEENGYGFDDILHKAILLLTDEKGNRTTLSESYAQRFREILIDEYQDTNEAQDLLFHALSRDGRNLFFVGDVKQSIYRFRLAMPEIFLSKKESLPLYEPGIFPSQILLDRNFRSREGICLAVNHVFSRLMTKDAAELDYSGGEALVPAAAYPPNDTPAAELHILRYPHKTRSAEAGVLEASYAAHYIEDVLNSGLKITENGVERIVEPGDICVLLRSAKDNAMSYFTAMKNRGIPAMCPTDTPFYSTREISFICSLLFAVDNPLLDVPLAAVLMFPVFGFTAGDLARIRICERAEPLYTGLTVRAAQGDERASSFLKTFARFRDAASTKGLVELLFMLYEETGVLNIVSAMEHGEDRRRNLLAFLEMTADYARGKNVSLGGFVRFLARSRKKGKGPGTGESRDFSAPEVKIMTIHKSKGLEFPIVILGGCGLSFNDIDSRAHLLIDRDMGIGMVRRDIKAYSKYKTVPFCASQIGIKNAGRAEEQRLLYVAMTRAKERLVMLGSIKDGAGTAAELMTNASGTPIPFAVKNAASYLDWLICALKTHPDAGALLTTDAERLRGSEPSDFRLKVINAALSADEETAPPAKEVVLPDEELMGDIRRRIDYVYPYKKLAGIPAKKTASSLAQQSSETYFGKSKPRFTPSEDASSRGTATHRFLEICDLRAAAADTPLEAARLLESGALTAEEYAMIDFSMPAAFFGSELGQRLLSSERVLREYQFSVFRPAGELYRDLDPALAAEKIVVEGILDCAFVENGQFVLIDYKTDRVRDVSALKERYKNQLLIYKSALMECEKMPVKETVIYSLYLSEKILL